MVLSGRSTDAPTDRPRRRARTRGMAESLQHPADRLDQRRGAFDQFSQTASHLASSSLFFVGCAVLVVAWAAGYVFGASDRFEAATAGLMAAVTLILVALLRN